MKILEVIYRFHPSVGGSQKVVYELSKEFARKGHDVTVVTSTSMTNNDTRGFSTGRKFTFKSEADDSYREEKEGIKVYRFKPSFQLWPYGFNPEMKRFLKKNIQNFDVVHVHGYQTYEADVISKLKSNFVLTAHDVIAHYGGFLGFLKKIFDMMVGKRILKRSKYLIALTPENIIQYNDVVDCEDKIKLIPDGIEILEKGPKSEWLLKKFGNPKKIVLFVGRVVKYKGAQDILMAAHQILDAEPSTKFVFVGEDQGYMEELKNIAKKLNISDKCAFEGRVSSGLDDYYNTADVFVLPSRGEGFGLTAVEAMSLGTPAVLADLGGLKHVLKMVGGYPINMDEDVPKQIAAHITGIFKDKDIDNKMKPVIEKTKQFTWDKISDKTLELFEEMNKK